MRGRLSKTERHQQLLALIADDPLLTDEMIAEHYGVSVQTIRLDRLELGVPEMRVRARNLAERARGALKTLGPTEIAGELVDLELGRRAVSVLETTRDMGFRRSGIVRGHHIFAQANSLAVAVIDAPAALTGSAKLQFHRPVQVGDRVVAKALVRRAHHDRSHVVVGSRVGQRLVFSARIVIFSMDESRRGATPGPMEPTSRKEATREGGWLEL